MSFQLGAEEDIFGPDVAHGAERNTSRTGHLLALKTKAELQASSQTIEAYITTVPIKSTGVVLK